LEEALNKENIETILENKPVVTEGYLGVTDMVYDKIS